MAGRFEFEIALHQLSGLGTPEIPGPLRMDLDSLGVMQNLEFVEINPAEKYKLISSEIMII